MTMILAVSRTIFAATVNALIATATDGRQSDRSNSKIARSRVRVQAPIHVGSLQADHSTTVDDINPA